MTIPSPTTRRRLFLSLTLLTCLPLLGCDKREPVGNGYTLVTPDALPDGHPGTALLHHGRTAWPNVYTGYFSPYPAARFLHDDIFVFVSAVPEGNDWSNYPQLFALRPGQDPVILSEHLLNRPLIIPSTHGGPGGTTFAVTNLAPTDTGIRVTFADWPSDSRAPTTTRDLSWSDLRSLLNDADTSARPVHHPLTNYRILPTTQTSAAK